MGEAAIITLILGIADKLLDLREDVIAAAEGSGQFTPEQRAEQRARLASQRARMDDQDARMDLLLERSS